MMRSIYILCFSCIWIFCCCGQNGQERKPDEKGVVRKTKQSEEAGNNVQKTDSTRKSYLRSLDEPDIKTAKLETYRYYWSLFLDNDYLFRIQKNASGIVTLTSKCVLHCKGNIRRVYKDKAYGAGGDTVIAACSQTVTEKDWKRFRSILNGSYYWALEHTSCANCEVLDGNGLTLESMSGCCDNDTLRYRVVSIHEPRNGNFREASIFLLRISELTKNDAALIRKLDADK